MEYVWVGIEALLIFIIVTESVRTIIQIATKNGIIYPWFLGLFTALLYVVNSLHQ